MVRSDGEQEIAPLDCAHLLKVQSTVVVVVVSGLYELGDGVVDGIVEVRCRDVGIGGGVGDGIGGGRLDVGIGGGVGDGIGGGEGIGCV
ncbi:hypothetical protein Tco_1091407 [Tanacetum coccineum]|uniref:Uncharacterized protein n=1 Tax=Tanacetum coccineum TaxID=301880 RepID=A0ABQ5I704_9ASTR